MPMGTRPSGARAATGFMARCLSRRTASFRDVFDFENGVGVGSRSARRRSRNPHPIPRADGVLGMALSIGRSIVRCMNESVNPRQSAALLIGILLTVIAVAAHRFLPERRLSLDTLSEVDTFAPGATYFLTTS